MSVNPPFHIASQAPEILQTNDLKKFLGATADHLFQPGSGDQLTGYIGQKPSYYNSATDFYIAEPTASRTAYQLEPTMISVAADGTYAGVLFYEDIVNQLRFQGALINDHNRLFENDYYSWAPPVDVDKLMNAQQYFWLNDTDIAAITVPILGHLASFISDGTTTTFDLSPQINFTAFTYNPITAKVVCQINGTPTPISATPVSQAPQFISQTDTVVGNAGSAAIGSPLMLSYVATSITIIASLNTAPPAGSTVEFWVSGDVVDDVLGQASYQYQNGITLSSNMCVQFVNDVNAAYTTGIYIVEGVGRSIVLVPLTDLIENTTAQYIVMERGCANDNPWSKANRWFHQSVFGGVSVTGLPAVYPILEFVRNLQLYNYGRNRRPDIQAVVEFTDPELTAINGAAINPTTGISTVLIGTRYLQVNDRILITQSNDPLLNGLVYRVNNDANQILLTVESDGEGSAPKFGDVLRVVDGSYLTTDGWDDEPSGWDDEPIVEPWDTGTDSTEIWYNGTTWVPAQAFLTDQQAPLFELYDSDGNLLEDPAVYPGSNFTGNVLFTYAVSSAAPVDATLGLQLTFDSYGNVQMNNALYSQTYSDSSGPIIGFYYHATLGAEAADDSYSNDWNLVDGPSLQTVSNGIYSIPANLQANPNNEEIGRKYNDQLDGLISRDQWFDHFTAILQSQTNFAGVAYASNNYRDTAKLANKSQNIDGSTTALKILQHRSPMLKLMLLASSTNSTMPSDATLIGQSAVTAANAVTSLNAITSDAPSLIADSIRALDYMTAVRYVDREYTRFRNKFIQKINSFYQQGALDPAGAPALWVTTALTALANNKNIAMPFHLSGMVALGDYIPATAAFLGITPVYLPRMLIDTGFNPSQTFILGHDGSLFPIFNDFRDGIILELETEIYNSVNANFRGDARPTFDVLAYSPGKFRASDYSHAEYVSIMQPIFERWAIFNGLDYRTNAQYNVGDPFTWNYSQSVDKDGQAIPGNWRGLYRYYYDTDRPQSAPWEMLGFTTQPSWWQSTYGPSPYTSGNVPLWTDLQNGYVAAGSRQGINLTFARPGLLNIIPVDEIGNLRNPLIIGIVLQAPTAQQASTAWSIGDEGPVEHAWIISESYAYALAQIGYLLKPPRFVEANWNGAQTLRYPQSAQQWVDAITLDRPQNSEYSVANGNALHGEGNPTIGFTIQLGLQQWIADYLISQGQNVTTIFGNLVRGLNVQLAHKMAGFSTLNQMQVLADNLSGPLPQENLAIQVYRSPSIAEEFYGGVIIEWVGTGWRVVGYDSVTPMFSTIPSDPNSSSSQISITGTAPPVIQAWQPNTAYALSSVVGFNNANFICTIAHTSAQRFELRFWVQLASIFDPTTVVAKYSLGLNQTTTVAYGTVFVTRQQVADFLFGYERYMVAQGWLFDQIDSGTGVVRDWSLMVIEFLTWANIGWQSGNFIALSPSANGVHFSAAHGMVQNLETLVNGAYSLLDRAGRPIDTRKLNIYRYNCDFTIVPAVNTTIPLNSNNIFANRISLVEIEHVLIFSNITIFNDIVYQPLYNLRQPRLRLYCTRTQQWTGRLDAPGYIVTNQDILPNFPNTVADIDDMFNIEVQDNPVLTKYARHVIGYQSRDYLTSLLIDETEQFEFYQGMIQQKGALGVYDKLLRSTNISQNATIEFLEEWGFRIGEYGALALTQYAEFLLQQSQIRHEPQLIQFWQNEDVHDATTDNPYDDRIELIDTATIDPRWITRPPSPTAFFPVRASYAKQPEDLPSAGYVRLDEVAFTLVTSDLLAAQYTNLVATGGNYVASNLIWVYDNGFGSFDVLRVCNTSLDGTANQIVATLNPAYNPAVLGTRFVFLAPHNLIVGNTIVIAGLTLSVPDAQGVHLVARVIDSMTIEIDDEGITTKYDWTNVTDNTLAPNVTGAPVCFVMKSVHFSTLADRDAAVGIDWIVGDLAYLDITQNGIWGTTVVSTAVWISDSLTLSWIAGRIQPQKMDTEKIINSLIFSTVSNSSGSQLLVQPTILPYIIPFDPIGGIIPGLVKRELYYQLTYDPAVYNEGPGFVDITNSWGATQIGRLWWDMTTVRFLETELNDLSTLSADDYDNEMRYRLTNWGQLAPGTSIDIYEWVQTDVSPTQYSLNVAASTDISSYSGQVLNADSPSWVEEQVWDVQLQQEVTAYYFWVENRITVPNVPWRKNSSLDLTSILANPSLQGIPWMSAVAANSLIISGVGPYTNDTDTALQIKLKLSNYDGVVHRQWLLLRDGDPFSQPTDQLWLKLRDSLVGRDIALNAIPDPTLPLALQTGNYFRPRQSWFDDISGARNAFINTLNIIFSTYSAIDVRPDLIEQITLSTPTTQALVWMQATGDHSVQALPVGGNTLATGDYNPVDEWNLQVTSFIARDALVAPAVGTRVLVNGLDHRIPQWSVWVYQDARDLQNNLIDTGYVLATAYDYAVPSIAARNALISAIPFVGGERVLVDGTAATNGFWVIYVYLPTNQFADTTGFVVVRTQTYNTTDFFGLTNWYMNASQVVASFSQDIAALYINGFVATQPPTMIFPNISTRDSAQSTLNFVEVSDDGTGRWIWCILIDANWVVVARQNASILLSSNFYDPTRVDYGVTSYDLTTIATRNGSWELRYLIDALRDVALLTSEVNTLFFSMAKYVLAEQEQVDWLIKTSFMTIAGFNEQLGQPPVVPADQSQNMEDYVNEVKPYRVKVRDFVISYSPQIDLGDFRIRDFDNPPYLDPNTGLYRPLSLTNTGDLSVFQTTDPWLSWYSNYLDAVSPVRQLMITIAFDRVNDTVQGWDLNVSWDTGWDNENVYLYAKTDTWKPLNAAARIFQNYEPTHGMPENNLPELLNSQFQGTQIDGNRLADPAPDDVNIDAGMLTVATTLANALTSSTETIIVTSATGFPTSGSFSVMALVMGPTTTNLATAITNLTTETIIVTDITGFPPNPPFWVTVGGEQMIITNGQFIDAQWVWSVVRGVNGTMATTAANGTPVTIINFEIMTITEGQGSLVWTVTRGANDSIPQACPTGTTLLLISSALNAADIQIVGTGFQDPRHVGHPEELIQIHPTDPFVLTIYQNWTAGAPAMVTTRGSPSSAAGATPEAAGLYELTELTESFAAGMAVSVSLGQIPQSNQALAVFLGGIRQPSSAYTVNYAQQIVVIQDNSAEIESLSFGFGGVSPILQQGTWITDGITNVYPMSVFATPDQILVTINGVYTTNFTMTTDSVSFGALLPALDYVIITEYTSLPIQVFRQEITIDLAHNGTNISFPLTEPSTGTVPPEAATIVEVNGLRLAAPQLQYVTIGASGQRIVPLNLQPSSYQNVRVYLPDGTRAIVGTIPSWVTAANINLQNIPPTIPLNANFVIVENYVVVVNVPYGDYTLWDEEPFGSEGSATNIVILINEDNDWYIDTNNNLIMKSALNTGDELSITTFTTNSAMEITSQTYFGNPSGIYAIPAQPFGTDYIWASLNGFFLRPGVDFSFVTADFVPWDEADWDTSPNTTPGIQLNGGQLLTDVLCFTVFSGMPALHSLAWRTFLDQFGTWEYLRLADDSKMRLVNPLNQNDTVITLVADPTTPTLLLPTPIISVPDITHNKPGIVWLQAERIEYFGLTQLDQRTYQLSNFQRGTRGTQTGTPTLINRAYYQGDGATTRFYFPQASGTNNVEVYLANFATGNSWSGDRTMIPGVDYIIGIEVDGQASFPGVAGAGIVEHVFPPMIKPVVANGRIGTLEAEIPVSMAQGQIFVQFIVAPPIPPVSINNIRIIQMQIATSDYPANSLVIDGNQTFVPALGDDISFTSQWDEVGFDMPFDSVQTVESTRSGTFILGKTATYTT